jgi:hypothetical protein
MTLYLDKQETLSEMWLRLAQDLEAGVFDEDRELELELTRWSGEGGASWD